MFNFAGIGVQHQQEYAIVKFETVCRWKKGELELPAKISLKSFHPAFDNNVFVTQNYGYLIDSQKVTDCELQFQRANVYYLFSKVKSTGELSCTVLTQKEAASWKALGKAAETSDKLIWLETPSCRNIKNIQATEQEAYEKILDQVQFLHGDIDLILKQSNHPWFGVLDPNEACRLLNQILSNPLFRQKKRFYDDHQDEILALLSDIRINNLLSLTNNYLTSLLEKRIKLKPNSQAMHAIQGKITIMEDLNACLLERVPVQQKMKNFFKILTPENSNILTARRYVSEGIIHDGGVFLKGLLLCIPVLLDVVSLGSLKWLKGTFITEMAHTVFFKVSGKEYVDKVTQKTQANKNINTP